MSEPEKWFVELHGYNWLVETEGKADDENFIADCGADDEAESLAKSIVADHNACIGIKDPETTVPELVTFAQRLRGRCLCHATIGTDISCLSCTARAILAKTGQKHEPPEPQ